MTSITRPRPCIACGGKEAAPLYDNLAKCADCGLIYYPDQVSRDEIVSLYDRTYFHGAEYYDYQGDRSIHEANFRKRILQLSPWVKPGSRLFEIGCSYGYFLNLAKQHWQVGGCDVAVEPCKHAQSLGLNTHVGDFTDVPLNKGDVDAFCLWDTIEHLYAPDLYLRRMAQLLNPGGVLALTTGDIGSMLAKFQGPRWRQIHPPTHLWYFSRETMQRLLARFGFEMVSFRRIGLWRSLGQIVYSLTSLNRPEPAPIHRLCEKLGLKRLGVWLNTFDFMFVVAKRTGLPVEIEIPEQRAA